MNFGFSYIGFLYLLMLFIPNFFWTKNKPADYDKFSVNENKILLIFERVGEISVSCLVLIFSDFNIGEISLRSVWLALSFIFMTVYEIYWIRYFKSEKKMKDFYGSFLHIPVPGAVIPVISFFLLGIYGKNIFLIIADTVLGIGHIGIHAAHKKEI